MAYSNVAAKGVGERSKPARVNSRQFSKWSLKESDPFITVSDPIEKSRTIDLEETKPEAKSVAAKAALKPLSKFSWKVPEVTSLIRHTSLGNTRSMNKVSSKNLFSLEASTDNLGILYESIISPTETWLHRSTKTSNYIEYHHASDYKHKDFAGSINKDTATNFATMNTNLTIHNDTDSEASWSEPSTPLRSTRYGSLGIPCTPATDYSEFQSSSALYSVSEGGDVGSVEVKPQGDVPAMKTKLSGPPEVEIQCENIQGGAGKYEELFEGVGYYGPKFLSQGAHGKRKVMLRKLAYERRDQLAALMKKSGSKTAEEWAESEVPLRQWDLLPDYKARTAT